MSTVLTIVSAGDPVLRDAARALSPDELRSAEIRKLVIAMRDTMRAAPGVGLAAPQVGVGLQLAVIEDRAEYHRNVSPEDLAARGRVPVAFHVIANPRLVIVPGEPVAYDEGCLSVPGYAARVARAAHVRVEALDEHGEPVTLDARGWYARILQHECDHLAGTLYVDRMDTRTFSRVTDRAKKK